MTRLTLTALRHVAFEDLGSFAPVLERAGYDIAYVDVTDTDPGALDPLAPDLLVVLGGPASATDTQGYPVMASETALLRARLEADRPTLGICLGAQLMALALGAGVRPARAKEIGWAALDLEDGDGTNPLAPLRGTPVLHWHGDTFDLPEGCARLASTPLCANQAFSRGPNILGLQFHPELVAARLERWTMGHANELAGAGVSPVVLREDTARHGASLERAATVMFTRWLEGLSAAR
ncbi:glutamine amidotransferase [Oceanicella sp. SM1341]|uniref:glutamine amidotransferase n=1 Tax=Oceanicella sp. SM1341 TaxID=1548889 RepID=UPI000E512FF3|nr:glutamine amidotransferase [Oceanicella sp. SM1341]